MPTLQARAFWKQEILRNDLIVATCVLLMRARQSLPLATAWEAPDPATYEDLWRAVSFAERVSALLPPSGSIWDEYGELKW